MSFQSLLSLLLPSNPFSLTNWASRLLSSSLQLLVARLIFLRLSHLNMQDSAVTPGISEATASQSCSSWMTSCLPVLFRCRRSGFCRHTWRLPRWVSARLPHSNSSWCACSWSSWVEARVLIDAQVDDLQDSLIAHEWLVNPFFPWVLLAVHQDIVSNLAVLQFSQCVHELTEALPGYEEWLEVLVRVLDGLGGCWRGVGELLLTALQQVPALPLRLVHLLNYHI